MARVVAASAEVTALLRPGDRLDRYLVLDVLGHGGMGVVYTAYDPELDRKVAVKLMPPRAGDDRGGRLLREAQALARLSHPNVVDVYDVGTAQGRIFIAMEYVEGVTLGDWLEQQKRSWSEVLEIMTAAARGLAAAHRADLAHLDFKPANVLVGDDKRVCVIDFGLAAAADDDCDGRPRRVMGTPGYMAPEQVAGEAAGPAADQFSFCIVLWEALYGVRALDADSLETLARRTLRVQLEQLPQDRSVPGWVHRVLMRGLKRDPQRRHASMTDVIEALSHDPGRARRRIGVVAAGGLLVAGGLWGHTRALEHRQGVCVGDHERFAGIWDTDRTATARSAFVTTGKPYAEDVFGQVAPTLDAYVARWAEIRHEACEATHVRGEQSEELLDARMHCLDQRRHRLQALTDLLVEADAVVVENAVTAAYGLPDVERCTDASRLGVYDEVPPDEDTQRELDRLRLALAKAAESETAGRVKEGAAQAAEVSAGARRMGATVLQAQAERIAGEMTVAIGDVPRGIEHLNRSLWLADAAGSDEDRVATLSELVWALGTVQADYEHGQRMAQMASFVLERVGGDPSREAQLKSQVANLHTLQGEYEQAVTHYARALELLDSTGQRTTQVPVAYNNLAAVYFNQGRYELALSHYERSRALWREFVGQSHPNIGILLGNIANVYQALGQSERALEYHERCVRIVQAASSPNSPVLGRVINNMAVALAAMDRPAEALKHYERAATLYEGIDPEHQMLGVIEINVGEVRLDEGDAEAALTHYDSARARLGKVYGANHLYVGHAVLGRGRALLALGRPQPAVAALSRAVEILRTARAAAHPVGQAKLALARAVWQSGGDRHEAIALAHQARAALSASGDKGTEDLAEASRWISEHPEP